VAVGLVVGANQDCGELLVAVDVGGVAGAGGVRGGGEWFFGALGSQDVEGFDAGVVVAGAARDGRG
jgi:hypothetical protein